MSESTAPHTVEIMRVRNGWTVRPTSGLMELGRSMDPKNFQVATTREELFSIVEKYALDTEASA